MTNDVSNKSDYQLKVKGQTVPVLYIRIDKTSRLPPKKESTNTVFKYKQLHRISWHTTTVQPQRPIWRAPSTTSQPLFPAASWQKTALCVRGCVEESAKVSADKFFERFRWLEEALGVRKAEARNRWACLPIRRCLNLKLRR